MIHITRFYSLSATVLLGAGALCIGSTARADPWPQSAISNYFSNCVTVHKERWRDVPETVVTRLCTCKVSKLQGFPWEQFAEADREVNSYYMEMFVALPLDARVSAMKDMDGGVALAMLRVVRAEEECASK
jgi:hypothetical protein